MSSFHISVNWNVTGWYGGRSTGEPQAMKDARSSESLVWCWTVSASRQVPTDSRRSTTRLHCGTTTVVCASLSATHNATDSTRTAFSKAHTSATDLNLPKFNLVPYGEGYDWRSMVTIALELAAYSQTHTHTHIYIYIYRHGQKLNLLSPSLWEVMTMI